MLEREPLNISMIATAHNSQLRSSRGILTCVALLSLPVISGLVQRACWIAHLSAAGYGVGEITVPMRVHLSMI
jgi:hypothetical protein